MTAGAWVLLAAVALALAFGGYRAYADGRFRGTHPVRGAESGDDPAASDASVPGPETSGPLLQVLEGRLGDRATFVQFSSAFCAPCRATRRVLADLAADTDGVAHVEIDAESHLELVRELRILRTPTTLVLDGSGAEVARAAGAPTREQARGQLAGLA